MFKVRCFVGSILLLVLICLSFSTIIMAAFYWPRRTGLLYFWIVSIPGFFVLGFCSLFLFMCLSAPTCARTFLYLNFWLLFISAWSGFIGAGLWLRYFEILATGTTINEPLPLDSAFVALNNATHDLPFHDGNPTFFIFKDWQNARLRYDLMSANTRDCSTSGYKTRYCLIPLVYQSWNSSEDFVQVWVGCSGKCERTTDDYGKSLEISSCEQLVSKGHGCFSWWKRINQTKNPDNDSYSEAYNYGYRHFQYIHHYRKAALNSNTIQVPDDQQRLVVLIRLSSPEDAQSAQDSFLRDGLAMTLTPLLVGYAFFISLLLCICKQDYNDTVDWEEFRSRLLFSSQDSISEQTQEQQTPLLSPEIEEILPQYDDLDIPPPSYEESFKYPHLQV